ncbi:MAG: CRISPR-associated endonuclease Cas2 [Saprospiraceae bacterium]|nr:CRISPR-associated endonuclease Cas2 [Lewinella sp.]
MPGVKIIGHGLDRVNKSVYLGTISDSSLKALETQLADWIRNKGEPQDSLIILPVTAQQIHNMRVYGLNDLDRADLSGEKSTIIV